MASPNLVVINTTDGLKSLISYLEDKTYVAFDTETTGLTARHQVIGFSICADKSIAYYVVLAAWDTSTASLQYLPKDYQNLALSLIESLKGKSLVMHNAVFDCMMAESNFKVRLIDSLHTDTMILAHLLDENRRIGLKELGASMYGESAKEEQTKMKASIIANGGKITKDSYELYKADSQLIGIYGAKDAWLTYRLFLDLVPELYKQKLDKFFYEDESMPLLRGPTYELNTTGLQVDHTKLTQLKKQLEAECLEAADFIRQEITPLVKDKYPKGFNINASQQLSWLLFGQLGLEFDQLTKAGKLACKQMGLKIPYTKVAKRNFIAECLARAGQVWQLEVLINGKKHAEKKYKEPWAYTVCDKGTLKKLAPKLKWVEKLLQYKQKKKLLTTYVEGIEERSSYGIIQPSFLQSGTTSGRYSSRNPNFQNLPRDDKRIKSCIVSRRGKTFIEADYSQLEPRVFASFSEDARLLLSFNGSNDFYSTIGMEVFQKLDCTPRKEGADDAFGVKYKKLRDISKVIALSSTYGSTAYKLAPTIGKSEEDTQQVIDNYFESFPGVKQMMLDSHEMAKTTGRVENLFGRPRRMPEAMKITKIFGNLDHGDLPYEARNLLNLAVNHRIQSTAASIVNRAAIRFYENAKQAGIDCKIVLQVHDSLVIECNEEDAKDVSALLKDAMENTTQLKGVKLEAIPKICKNLGHT